MKAKILSLLAPTCLFTAGIVFVLPANARELSNVDDHLKRAAHYVAAGSYENARMEINQALDLDPNCAQAYYLRGCIYRDKDRDEMAIADYTKAIELDSKHGPAYLNRGQLHTKAGRFRDAFEDLTKAVVLHKSPEYAFYWRSKMWQELHRFQDALKDIEQAILRKPEYDAFWVQRAVIHGKLGDRRALIEDYTKLIRLGTPRDLPLYLCYRAETFFQLEDHRRAVDDCTEAIRLSPTDREAYMIRANAFRELGEPERARKDDAIADSLKPSD